MSWSPETKLLKNEWIELRTMHPADLEDVYQAMIPDPDGWYSVMFGLNTKEAFEREFESSDQLRQLRSGMGFVIRDVKTRKVAGISFFLKMDSENRSLEIGTTIIAPHFRRTYINTATKLLLLHHAFENLGCIRVSFRVDLENKVSKNAIERLGAVLGGTLRSERILPDGRIRDYLFYSLIKSEWPACRALLSEKLESHR